MLRYVGFLLLLPGACFAQDVARMDEIVQSFVSGKEFMGSVLVARGDHILLNKGYGSADLEWNIPNTPSTKFRLGSVTKQFTAASILLLEERGKLKVGDPVRKYLPDAPASWDKVTIFNLLTHTSGIPSFTSFPEYQSIEPFAKTPEQIVALFRDKPLEFQPGEKWEYSNSGYVLLGFLIEKISGVSYEKFVQDNIFTPLAMKDSGYDSNSAIIARRASGYAPGAHGPVNAGFINMSIPFAAGGLYSTTEDLLRWEQGLFGGKLLTAPSLQRMTTPFKHDYAFGLGIHVFGKHKVVEHAGGIEGFNSSLAFYPEDHLTIVVLSNLNGGAPDSIAQKLAAVTFGEVVTLPSERKEVSVPVQVLSERVGTYQFDPGYKMLIALEGDHLTEKLADQAAYPIFAQSEDLFFLKVVDAQIEFGKDDAGSVTYLVLHQNGRDQKAMRTSRTVETPPKRKEVKVSPALLAEYRGTYQLHPGFDIVMTVEAGQLMTQATGQSKFPLYAESDTKFFAKVVDAQIDFVRDDKGKVTQLILHQGGRDLAAPKL
ncbi:MAG TPA: serine hydrolase [Rudaea sp.]